MLFHSPGPLEPRRPDLSVADGGLPQPRAAGINGCRGSSDLRVNV